MGSSVKRKHPTNIAAITKPPAQALMRIRLE
jgi:hypothetical protein